MQPATLVREPIADALSCIKSCTDTSIVEVRFRAYRSDISELAVGVAVTIWQCRKAYVSSRDDDLVISVQRGYWCSRFAVMVMSTTEGRMTATVGMLN